MRPLSSSPLPTLMRRQTYKLADRQTYRREPDGKRRILAHSVLATERAGGSNDTGIEEREGKLRKAEGDNRARGWRNTTESK